MLSGRTASAALAACRLPHIAPRASVASVAAAASAASSTSEPRFRSEQLDLPVARYGGRQTVSALPGDGIGPEMFEHVKTVFEVAEVPIDFEDVSLYAGRESSDIVQSILSIKRNGVALKGNHETRFDSDSDKSRNVHLRAELDLYANILHCQSVPGVPARHHGVDIVLIRQNTEGEYSGLEHEAIPGIVESLKIVTRYNIERIARFAFDYARRHGRKKVTAVHKANIQKLADGMFLHVCGEIAELYGDVEFDNMIIDNASMQLVSNPSQFDVVVLPNLYGNIVSNIACGVVGGPGLVAGANIGPKHAVFETGTRNTGMSLAGLDLANPTASLRAAVEMLRYLAGTQRNGVSRLSEKAQLLDDAIMWALTERKLHTADIGGTARTSEFVAAVVKYIEENM